MEDGDKKILVSQNLLMEVCGALTAISMTNENFKYLEVLVGELLESVENNE